MRSDPVTGVLFEPPRTSTDTASVPTFAEPVKRNVAGIAAPHILFVIDQLCHLGGAEQILFEIVRRLPQEGFRPAVVTFQLDPSLEAIQALQCPLHVLPLRRTYDFNAAKMALRLHRLIRDERVSIVHTFFESSDLWAAPIAKASGCPIVVSSRRDLGILRTRKHQFAYSFVNRVFDRVIAVSSEVQSYCVEHDGLSREKVEVIYNGVDIAAIGERATRRNFRQDKNIPLEAPMVTTLANIRHVKGIDVLVRAAARVRRILPNVLFVVAGKVLESQTIADLYRLIKLFDLVDNVRFVSHLSNPYPLLQASNVFCLPSRSEGFSNALIEAMASGLPCVASRVGGNSEAITEGITGYLVESGDDLALSDALLRLLRDPSLAHRMGQAARAKAEREFSIQTMMSRLVRMYTQLLEGTYA